MGRACCRGGMADGGDMKKREPKVRDILDRGVFYAPLVIILALQYVLVIVNGCSTRGEYAAKLVLAPAWLAMGMFFILKVSLPSRVRVEPE